MRRLLSISLLLLFMLPLVSPLFAASAADAEVPVCCRRDGKHHCIMSAVAKSLSGDTAKAETASLQERCPYNPVSPAAVNLPFVPHQIQAAIFTGILNQSAYHAQTETTPRITPDRSHQKRGPPTLTLSRS